MAINSSCPEDRMSVAAATDVAAIMEQYESRPEGHFNEEITTSRIKYGRNEISNNNKYATLKRLYRSFMNIFIITLGIIDILWMVLDPDIIYFVILTTLILVSGSVTFIQETRSSKAAAKLMSMVTTIITVRREDAEIEIDSKELVVGDIIILDTGDMVPADVRIISSNHLQVDQSALTGESGGVRKIADKDETEINVLGHNNLAFMGSSVIGGSAEAIVIAVGDDTIFGSMAEKLTRKKAPTTYDKGSKSIVSVLLRIMYLMVPPVFLIMLIRDYMTYGTLSIEGTLSAVTFALTLAIGLMPEMLATIVSANLAKGAIDMSKNKVIVKDVTSIQNFGAMDVLCSDKTGTLTQNRISVHDCNDIYGNPRGSVELMACLNARYLKSATNQIDWALDEYAEEYELGEKLDAYEYVGDIPFDFNRRRATVIVKQDDDIDIMISKGAMPEILSISSGYLDAEGNITPLDSKIVNEMLGLVEWYSGKGMRVLGVSHKYIPHGKTEFSSEDESDLIVAGFVVFSDPVKPSAKNAIEDMKEYGIAVKVLTGDNEYVSKNVCEQIGIDADNFVVGTQIDAMSDSELRNVVENTNIFARLSPDNKSRIVQALKSNGHTVGLMGDGINDVIAMKNADVSISVDTGTDIAKETASMILLEKDLGILKTGAIEGRKVYVNSIKYVKMIGSINFGYMFSLILGTLFFNFEPMGGVMILIFNLINDFACIFICWDKVDDEFVKEPRKWDAPNLKSVMFRYGPMCVVTDLMSWAFFIWVVLPTIAVTIPGSVVAEFPALAGVTNASQAVLSGAPLSDVDELLPIAVLFQSLWCIEQYWMQVWSIHIVRTNKLPFFQAWSSKILVATTIIALTVGTCLPFTGPLWEAISSCTDLIAVPLWALLWMPFIGAVYFFGSHMIKRRMLRTHGYFAC
ncbi:MAG: magnesium-translocating P-type ATPase [Candidatus Methanomethylophilaceae archaeon]|nr:magnesium-translocating P-type ATPase [Candidatus Methanomethylophilaceae archaeon]